MPSNYISVYSLGSDQRKAHLDGGEISAQERERLPAVAHALELQNPTDALLRRHRRDERVPAVEVLGWPGSRPHDT